MTSYSSFLNRRVSVFFDDKRGGGKRVGILTHADEAGIVLDNKELIPKERIIRMELEINS